MNGEGEKYWIASEPVTIELNIFLSVKYQDRILWQHCPSTAAIVIYHPT
jgi:hypothetical protein